MLLKAILIVAQVSPAALVDSAILRGITARAFPGAVVVIGSAEGVLYAKGLGHFTWEVESPVPDPETTLFDLASLTKIVATTPSMMRLIEQGRLDLDVPVTRYLPTFEGNGNSAVTVRHLLEHRSGLRAFLPLNTETRSAREAKERVLAEPVQWAPGGRVEYSDLNAMLMGWVVEAASGDALDTYASGAVFERVGMPDTRFRPLASEVARIAPVGLWRGHPIAGEIHDQNAARLGGVSGHAGLYSTGADLARYARMWLGKGRIDQSVVFRAGMVEHFTRRGAGNRALGWEMRDTTSSDNTGSLMSPAAFGHTGFTGTSIWIDPREDVFVLLLTNRVFSSRSGSIRTLKRVRGEVADAAVQLRRSSCRTPPC